MAEQDYFIIENSGQPMMNGVMVFVIKNESALSSLPDAAAPGSIAVMQDASKGWMKSLGGTWGLIGAGTESGGMPVGGVMGQVLMKMSASTYDADWATLNAAIPESLAIVANGNTHGAIVMGQYVYVRGHATLAEGMYKATSAISANAALSSGNLTALPKGGLNALNSESIVPMAENIIPANADFNDYSAAGVYRVTSDAIGQTIQNIPYYASGKLIVIARTTSTTYTMQIWIPSTSAQRMFVRNYNAGSFSDWKELAFYETGTWVPHLYDMDTKIMEGSPQTYYKIGEVCFAPYRIVLSADLTVQTMLQFRNLPFSRCWTGSFWSTSWGDGGGAQVRVIQPISGSAFFRPNITGTFGSGITFSGVLIGK